MLQNSLSYCWSNNNYNLHAIHNRKIYAAEVYRASRSGSISVVVAAVVAVVTIVAIVATAVIAISVSCGARAN